MLKFVIYGIGHRGKLLLEWFDKKRVAAIVDRNPALQGTQYEGIDIISLDEYEKRYADCFIIVTPSDITRDIIADLKRRGIRKIFSLIRAPMELTNYEASMPFEEMLHVAGEMRRDMPIALWGINLFTILLYEHLLISGYRDVSIMELSEQRDLISELQQADHFYKFISQEKAGQKNAKILIVDRFLHRTSKSVPQRGICFYKFFDLSCYKDYPDLGKFHNIHQGESCFVIGTGPSLKIADLDTLHQSGVPCFGVNTVYKAYSRTEWRPTYHVSTDPSMYDFLKKDIGLLEGVEAVFLGDRARTAPKTLKADNLYIYHSSLEYFEEEGPDFSDDPNRVCYGAGSVLYTCLQLAAYMGFCNIYIIGADCEYKNHGMAGDHFIDDYDDSGAEGRLITEDLFNSYKSARRYAEVHHIHIYNATRGGILEVFDRVDFDSLFHDGKFTMEYATVHHRDFVS